MKESEGSKGSQKESEADSITIHQQEYRPLTPDNSF